MDSTESEKPDEDRSWLDRNYMLSTTAVAALTAGVNLFIIFWMSGSNPTVEKIIEKIFGEWFELSALDFGLGLAAIGIITFFGMSLSSSIFEEHRHGHKKKQENHFIQDALIGKGIMRKALASSLVLTYIVLIGMSYSDGSIDNLFDKGFLNNTSSVGSLNNSTSVGSTVYNFEIASLNNSSIMINSRNVIPNIGIKDIVTFDTIGDKIKSTGGATVVTESNSLVQHFTTIVSIVVGFYFTANITSAIIKSRKKQLSPKVILQTRLASGDIGEKEYARKMKLLEE